MAVSRWGLYIAVLLASTLVPGCSPQSDISFFVLVKSSNYAQHANGELELLNYHFFSEIFLTPAGSVSSATMSRLDGAGDAMAYVSRGDNFYFEGGHFDSVEEVDLAYPNGDYVFDISAPTVEIHGLALTLAGPSGITDIPEPIRISLWQDGAEVNPLAIDPDQDLMVRWSAYSNGVDDPRGIVDDMIFFVVADCHGERTIPSGLPFQGEYMTHRTREYLVEAGLLRAGQPYSAFVEFPHVVDSRIERGVPGFTSYATATYLDLRTTGAATDESCPSAPPPMDTGQTDRMDPPTVDVSRE